MDGFNAGDWWARCEWCNQRHPLPALARATVERSDGERMDYTLCQPCTKRLRKAFDAANIPGLSIMFHAV